VIVLDQGGLRTGFVVDRIHEVLRVPLSRIAPPPALVRSANESVRGIIERENRAILLLESGTLLSREELRLAEDSQREEDRSVPRTEEEYRVFVVFVVDGQEYGVPIDRIREINRIAGVTRIPRSPAYVEGIMNLRGEVLPVVSLRKKFDLRAAERDEQSRVLVSEQDGGVTGSSSTRWWASSGRPPPGSCLLPWRRGSSRAPGPSWRAWRTWRGTGSSSFWTWGASSRSGRRPPWSGSPRAPGRVRGRRAGPCPPIPPGG
jgi:chemotaxis signal transduction protein